LYSLMISHFIVMYEFHTIRRCCGCQICWHTIYIFHLITTWHFHVSVGLCSLSRFHKINVFV